MCTAVPKLKTGRTAGIRKAQNLQDIFKQGETGEAQSCGFLMNVLLPRAVEFFGSADLWR